MSLITSHNNSLVKHLVKLRTNSRYRNEHKSLLVIGSQLIGEIFSVCKPKRVFLTSDFEYLEAAPSIFVTEDVLKKITNQPSPEGIVAEFPLPEPRDLKAPILVLDRISDPGNMGSLLRTALALEWGGLFFLAGGCDPFHEKVVSASKGALFQCPYQLGDAEALSLLKEDKQLSCYVADMQGASLEAIEPVDQLLLIMGHESEGPSRASRALGSSVTIPISKKMESLNVAAAGAILMYQMRRRS